MEAVFLRVFNTGIAAGWLILAVLILRPVLKRAPKNILCILWALVFIRLLIPFSIESAFSLVPAAETVSPEIVYSEAPAVTSGIPAVDGAVNSVLSQAAPSPADSVNPVAVWLFAATVIWLSGMGLLIFYAAISMARLYGKVREGVRLRDNVWICDRIDTPFILGILRPRIYLPSTVSQEQMEYVLAHEKFHIRRHDHWWKPLGFLALTLYWFHPLVWAAFLLFGRDLELACDEGVIRNYGLQEKKAYSAALLEYSVRRQGLAACPLAFGEVGVKERIKLVLNYRRPAFWVIAAAFSCCAVLAVCFFTSPEKQEASTEEKPVEQIVEEQVLSETEDKAQEEKEEPQGEKEKPEQAVSAWAEAFVQRDGQTIVSLASEELSEELKLTDILMGSDNRYSFGWSSPWPWENEDAVIQYMDLTNREAGICYYAWTSDPHITVWVETLTYEWVDGECVFTEEQLTYCDAIASGWEFDLAYPDGKINGTRMDYLNNKAGETLNQNALAGPAQSGLYGKLFEPESAAIALLNLLDNPNKVEIRRLEKGAKGGSVGLEIHFTEDGATKRLTMVQPYGESGIWVPQDAAQEPVNRLMRTSWDEVQARSLTADSEPDWKDIVWIGGIPEKQITLYGYNDEEYSGIGVAVRIGEDVNCFGWYYMSSRMLYPGVYWKEEERQLQVSLKTITGTGLAAEELHVLDYYDTGTLGDNTFGYQDYISLLSEYIDYEYDEETALLSLKDRRSGEKLAEAKTAPDERIQILELGSISEFVLGSAIYLRVETGYFPEGGVIAEYEGMPVLEAEVVINRKENETLSFDLGEIRQAE